MTIALGCIPEETTLRYARFCRLCNEIITEAGPTQYKKGFAACVLTNVNSNTVQVPVNEMEFWLIKPAETRFPAPKPKSSTEP